MSAIPRRYRDNKLSGNLLSCRFLLHRRNGFELRIVAGGDTPNIVYRLSVRGHSVSEFKNGALSGIITRQRQGDVPVELLKKTFQIARAAHNVLCRVKGIGHAKA